MGTSMAIGSFIIMLLPSAIKKHDRIGDNQTRMDGISISLQTLPIEIKDKIHNFWLGNKELESLWEVQ